MKKIVRLVFTAFFFFPAFSLFAQDLTGIWRGYFITENGEQYKYEVQLNQTKKTALSGVTYSYLDTRFYGKAAFTGMYTKASKSALVQETKTVELRMSGSSVACIMKCRLVYDRSGKEEFLEGVFTSTYEKTNVFSDATKGGNCGGGKVYLRKVTTSDFYVEPFLRNKNTASRPAPEKDTAKTVTARKPPVKKPATKTPPKTETVITKPHENAVVVQPEKKPELTAPIKPVVPKIIPPPVTIRDRKNELMKTITVGNKEVQISLYDNGEIDDDTVSIYLDGALILANKRLSTKPITYTLHLDESTPEHTLTMVAENLGRIPPNTSLMIIQDGDKRYQVGITSTEQKNAMIRFRYDPGG